MNVRTLALLSLGSALLLSPSLAAASPHDEILIRLAPGADRADVLRDAGVRTESRLSLPGASVVETLPGTTRPEALRALAADPRVLSSEPQRLVRIQRAPNDTSFSSLWGLGAEDGINAPAAWDIQTGSARTLVAVVDTGLDTSHPDLAPNSWSNPGEVGTDSQGRDKRTNGIDDDANGYVDDWRGWDFIQSDNDPTNDGNGHGTHVAGTIGARGNDGAGVVGVNWTTSLVGVRVLGSSGSGTLDQVAQGLDYAGRIGARVVNVSLGWSGPESQIVRQAIARHPNTLYVVAAGNSGDDLDAPGVDFQPCETALPNLICIASHSVGGDLSYFSNHGQAVALAAPGQNILSTTPGGKYAQMSGTSMAAPHASGVAALVASHRPEATVQGLKDALVTGTPVSPLLGKAFHPVRLSAPLALTGPSPILPSPTTAPEIYAGAFRPGARAQVTIGRWTGTPNRFSVTWERCAGGACTPVGSEPSYRIQRADVGAHLRATITARSVAGAGSATTTSPVISPSPSGLLERDSSSIRLHGTEPGDMLNEVAGVGDINADGIPDMGVAGQQTFGMGSGRMIARGGSATVTFGGPSRIDSPINALGDRGVVFRAPASWMLGFIAGAGDLTGDGIDDLLVGANGWDSPRAPGHGVVFVIPGREIWPQVIDLDAMDRTGVYEIRGDGQGAAFGMRMSGISDQNGDGLRDIVITDAYQRRAGDTSAGAAWVIYSRPQGGIVNVGEIRPDQGRVIRGTGAYQRTGSSLAVSDLNGDGADDIVIGAPGWGGLCLGSGEDRVHVIWGARQVDIDLASMSAAHGFTITGPQRCDMFGAQVGAGDVDGDGRTEIIVGAPATTSARFTTGAIHVLSSPAWGADVRLRDSASGIQVRTLAGDGQGFGEDLAVGHLNTDAIADIVIGSWRSVAPDGPSSGRAWVVMGSTTPEPFDADEAIDGLHYRIEGRTRDALGSNVAILGDVDDNGTIEVGIAASWANRQTGEVMSIQIPGPTRAPRPPKRPVTAAPVVVAPVAVAPVAKKPVVRRPNIRLVGRVAPRSATGRIRVRVATSPGARVICRINRTGARIPAYRPCAKVTTFRAPRSGTWRIELRARTRAGVLSAPLVRQVVVRHAPPRVR